MQKDKQKKATEHRDTTAKPQHTPAEQHKGDDASHKQQDHSSQANKASEEHSKKS